MYFAAGPEVGIVTASSNDYFITVTDAKEIVTVASLPLQRHIKIVTVAPLPLQRHIKIVTVSLLPLLTVHSSVALVTLL